MTSGTANELRISLGDPGMTALHRAGLGGLWLTLDAIEREPQHHQLHNELLALGGSWQKDDVSVTFRWEGDGRAFFQRLIAESFRVTDDGRVWFLGLGHPNDQGDHGLVVQNGMLNTFLQHGPTRNRAARALQRAVASHLKLTYGPLPASESNATRTVEIDGMELVFSYRAIAGYPHQTAAFDPHTPCSVVGWQFPGGTVRHTQFTDATSIREFPGAWLALLYAPVGAIYFEIRRRSRSIRHQACLVFPDVTNLGAFALLRKRFASARMAESIVAGTVDAAVRVMAELQVSDLLRQARFARCVAASFGVVPWSTQQKTRIDLFEVQPLGPAQLEIARQAKATLGAVLDTRFMEANTTTGPRWQTSPVLDLVARNLAQTRPWWTDFAHLEQDVDLRTQTVVYERALRRTSGADQKTGLTALVTEQGVFDDMDGAEVIVRACHEAWRRRQGALGEEARERGVRFEDLVDRERERLRIAFRNSRNAETLRAVLTDFWSRAGPNSILQEDWRVVLPYLSEERWQQARDLALLALASYSSQGLTPVSGN
jgi:CRISPR-associated protein Cas8a1/Csx13